MTFEKLGVGDVYSLALEKLNITTPTPVQEKAIPALLGGKDVLAKSRTGTGKTFAYGLPLLQSVDVEEKATQGLVVCPTRELAVQVAGELRKLNEFRESCKVVLLVGGSTMERQIKELKSGGKVVVGTPGRLADHLRRRTLKLHAVKTLVLDEADEMLEMGFREELNAILKAANRERITALFSATMPAPVKEIAKNYMKSPVMLELDNDENGQVLQYYVSVGAKDKLKALVELYYKVNPRPAIVFCNTKTMVDSLEKSLKAERVDVVKIHGDMPSPTRKKIMESVKNGEHAVLVATDVAARGIDISDVEAVFNYDIPKQTEWYVHRIGRTGRAGKTGVAYSLCSTPSQREAFKKIVKETGNKVKEYFSAYSVKPSRKTNGKTGKPSYKMTDKKGNKPYKKDGKPSYKKDGKSYKKGKTDYKKGGKPTYKKTAPAYKRIKKEAKRK